MSAISPDKRGFVPGRSMLSDVVDVDEGMMITVFSKRRDVAWFFDFHAAFPSVPQEFLLRLLRIAGLPPWLLEYMEHLCHQNRFNLVVGGFFVAGTLSHAGIRQGCPLSPILSAVAIHILLSRLNLNLPGILVRAFAGDIALVVPDVATAAPLLPPIFADFAILSGLHLNLPKT